MLRLSALFSAASKSRLCAGAVVLLQHYIFDDAYFKNKQIHYISSIELASDSDDRCLKFVSRELLEVTLAGNVPNLKSESLENIISQPSLDRHSVVTKKGKTAISGF